MMRRKLRTFKREREREREKKHVERALSPYECIKGNAI